jgi:hypothetical protein
VLVSSVILNSNNLLSILNKKLCAGTILGRPVVESSKTVYTITARNEVNATQNTIELQILVPPSNLQYTYPSVIYKAGKLDFPAWMAARVAFINKFGKRLTEDSLSGRVDQYIEVYLYISLTTHLYM